MTMIKVSKFDGDPGVVRDAFAQFPSGVAVLATHIRGEKHALVASSFMVGVSLAPCLVAVAVQKTSTTWELIKDAGAFGVSIFGKGQGDLTRKLASKDRAARFDKVAIEVGDSGAIFIEDAAMWLQCSTHVVSEAGDHWLIMLEVKKLGVGKNEALVWHGRKFRELAELPSVVGA
ncbi:NADH-FMN oxidoreductase RutF, flavin reductase (DIM6/NTAB) family [Rhizobium mongolense subsp. loessense]|uniref:NADH-FMN oxidoreductase RutF, flavin reductase (DIM6/NTAB) family n=1 Tax=Rhizobium mongolense subsp. loessense TaxID=158890 RepID=A0A1G4TQ77_9HYPH|nr:flavin reductase family protein [Rhizobium mongolense]NRP90604.1 p-hydroxyphenylacetate 3-hydroxylase, reductase component [Ensifer adhaerens]SCW83544.1 NADH-FMN oxidoreductase RutF, flavin reductase (DIM6/NTAB) family [Rhizobium mongolense subsp. loessense]